MGSTPTLRATPKAPSASLAAESRWTSGPAIVVYLSLATLLLHLAVAGRYHFFRDELYYIAASKHLDLGYVDFPPFIALITALTRWTLGESLLALHILPALAGAFDVEMLARNRARAFDGAEQDREDGNQHRHQHEHGQ